MGLAKVEENIEAAKAYCAGLNASGLLPDGVSVAHMGPWHLGDEADVGNALSPRGQWGRSPTCASLLHTVQ